MISPAAALGHELIFVRPARIRLAADVATELTRSRLNEPHHLPAFAKLVEIVRPRLHHRNAF